MFHVVSSAGSTRLSLLLGKGKIFAGRSSGGQQGEVPIEGDPA